MNYKLPLKMFAIGDLPKGKRQDNLGDTEIWK